MFFNTHPGSQMSIERTTISGREWVLICPVLSTLLLKVKIGNLDKCQKFVGWFMGFTRRNGVAQVAT